MNGKGKRKRWGRWIFLLFVVITLCLTFVLIHHHKHSTAQTPIVFKEQSVEQPAVVVKQQLPWFTNPSFSWTKITIKRGDSLYLIFKKQHVSYSSLKKILMLTDAKKYLGHLRTGRSFYLRKEPKTKQIMIKYPIDEDHTLYVYYAHGKFNSRLIKKPLTKHMLSKFATIKKSFFLSARKAGLTYAQIHQLSNIFAGHINFSRDIHPGDQFCILYNEYYWHEKKEKTGNIVAASFTNQGKTYTALRFTYPYKHSGYYMPNGHGVEPLFLRRPLRYKRISGYFSLHRYDPVIHIVHPHLGVDFAAPYGTKIKSIGDGKIIFRGKKGGYGNAIIVRYNKKYKALYGHMSRFVKGQRVGTKVKKGQIIGYVGSTGWATGPHLHFEMYVHGIPHNPLKMKFIGGKSIPKDYLQTFYKKANMLLAKLKTAREQQ